MPASSCNFEKVKYTFFHVPPFWGVGEEGNSRKTEVIAVFTRGGFFSPLKFSVFPRRFLHLGTGQAPGAAQIGAFGQTQSQRVKAVQERIRDKE